MTVAPPATTLRQRLRRFALRGVLSQLFCLAIATVFFLVERHGHPFTTGWAYSAAIGGCSWLFIDGARTALVAFDAARFSPDGAAPRWSGPAWLLVCIAVGAPAGYAVGTRLAQALLGHPSTPLFADRTMLAVSLIAALAASGYFLINERLHSARAAAESARRIAAEHELKLLESQLEPHMLFNTLANLRVLIAVDPPRAQAMLDRLIAFLRAMLGASRVGAHALSAEFERIGDYLELMQVRMGERLQTALALPPGLAGAQVPPFLLQPLVENAIRHGLEPKVAGGRIEITAARDGEALVLRVRDTGVGAAAAATHAGDDGSHAHFGLAQVRERLASLYGPAASLTLAPADDGDGGMLATVRLPLQQPS